MDTLLGITWFLMVFIGVPYIVYKTNPKKTVITPRITPVSMPVISEIIEPRISVVSEQESLDWIKNGGLHKTAYQAKGTGSMNN
jgi:hypothetical protein